MVVNTTLAVFGFFLMFVMMLLRVPIGVAMGVTGVVGFSLHSGVWPGLALLGQVPWSVVTDYRQHEEGRSSVTSGTHA